MLNDLLDQQLTFSVRVAGVHELAGTLDSGADDGQLTSRLGPRYQFPLTRHDGQVVPSPWLERWVIGIRGRLFQQMPETPGDLGVADGQVAVMFLCSPGQGIGDGARQARFFRNDQSHGAPQKGCFWIFFQYLKSDARCTIT